MPHTCIFKQLNLIFNCLINLQCTIILIKFVKDEYVDMLNCEHRWKIDGSALEAKDHRKLLNWWRLNETPNQLFCS